MIHYYFYTIYNIIIMYIFIIIIVKKDTVRKLRTYSAHIYWPA